MNWTPARSLRAIILVATPLFLQFPAAASDLIVPAGCDAPTPSRSGRTFYIDPVHGSMANDGSAGRPWRSFAEVAAKSSHAIATRAYSKNAEGKLDLRPVNPDGPVKPGDTLVLMSGDHGAVDLSQYQNENFIFVVAGENQTPVIRTLRLYSSTRWFFKGIKFQESRPEKELYARMVELAENAPFFGPGGNIVFVSNSFSTQDDTSDWSGDDWVNKPFLFAFQSLTRCTTLIGNHFYNVRNAAAIGGDDSLAMDNLLEAFGNDGFDIAASNLTLRHNVIRSGHHGPKEPGHPDGIQGWTVNGSTNRKVIIDANMVINPNQSDDNALQGISIFDGSWDGVSVTNNVVITNTWHGIALYGVKNSTIINNTVIPARPGKYMTWITVHSGKDNSPSTNVVVRNNITGGLVIDDGENINVDHNIALGTIPIARSRKGYQDFGGVTASHNLDKVPAIVLFQEFDMSTAAFNLHLSANSLARESGSDEGAPALDLEGRPRKPPVDIGAYAR
jgi:parallel beta-helix repeat protein